MAAQRRVATSAEMAQAGLALITHLPFTGKLIDTNEIAIWARLAIRRAAVGACLGLDAGGDG